jgi:hypothetical protein
VLHPVILSPPRRRRTRLVLAAVLATGALAVAGCGGDEPARTARKATATPEEPTSSIEVPDGVTLTKAGAELRFGQPAVVAYQANTQRGSALQLSVDSVRRGRTRDLAAYQLDAQARRSRVYYARVGVENVGTGDLSHTAIPLYAVDRSNTLVQATSFNTTFARCPSGPLPAGFTAGKAVRTCLVYLVRPGQSLVMMSYRPQQTFEPITWKGTILPPAPAKKNTTPRVRTKP